MVNDSGEKPSQLMFWGCFIALITTAFAFITRSFMVTNDAMWPADFGLDKVQAQVLFGHGIWPFAISIILFSLVIDKIGYRVAMFFSFICYAVYAGLALWAYSIVKEPGLAGDALLEARRSGLTLLTIGSIVLGLGNGTVEAFINPIVATNLAVDFFNLPPWFFVYLSKSLSVGSDIIRSQKLSGYCPASRARPAPKPSSRLSRGSLNWGGLFAHFSHQ
jgi:MFS family permease